MSRRDTDRAPQGEFLKGNTPTLVLAILEQEGALHGYGIARQIEQRSADALRLGEGSLYPTLRTMEADGWVESRWELQPSGPARKVYALTDEGDAELTRRIDAWQRFTDAMNAVLGPQSDAPRPRRPLTPAFD